jgi:predicted amidohydrolase
MAQVRVAAIQMDPKLGQTESNLREVAARVRAAASEGARFIVLPECVVTGYMFASYEEGMAVAQTVPGPSTGRLEDLCAKYNVYLVAGLLERDGDRLFNSAVVVGPSGLIGTYRKTHTLCLGVDRFTTPGDLPYTVYDLPIGRIGVLICYDLRFPEAARALGLAGAQLLALPTNWPRSSGIMPEVFARSRAAENRMYLVAADRVGAERSAVFLGRSTIVGANGSVIAEAGMDEPEMLIADLDLAEADRTHIVFEPGEHEMDLLGDRRPELYGGAVRASESVPLR